MKAIIYYKNKKKKKQKTSQANPRSLLFLYFMNIINVHQS